MGNAWISMQYAWEHGAVARGNHEGVLHAEQLAAAEHFYGGRFCPLECGSWVRFLRGAQPEVTINNHLRDPALCNKHPDHGKA